MSVSKTERNKQLVKLRKKGYTFGELGGKFGMSKQRAWKINNNPRWHQGDSLFLVLLDHIRGMFGK